MSEWTVSRYKPGVIRIAVERDDEGLPAAAACVSEHEAGEVAMALRRDIEHQRVIHDRIRVGVGRTQDRTMLRLGGVWYSVANRDALARSVSEALAAPPPNAVRAFADAGERFKHAASLVTEIEDEARRSSEWALSLYRECQRDAEADPWYEPGGAERRFIARLREYAGAE